MATADKLITVAENVPKVYHAGQMNVVKSSTYLSGFKYGKGEVTINDISPIDHILTVAVSTGSDELLYELPGFSSKNYNFSLNYNLTLDGRTPLSAPYTYKVSFNASIGDVVVGLQTKSINGGYLGSIKITNGYNQFYFTPTATIGYISFSCSANPDKKLLEFTDICIYKFESDKGLSGININALNSSGEIVGTYVSSEGGMVDDVSSIYPVTQLKADDKTVTISCSYYKDIDKTIKNLQTNIALSGGE